MLLYVEKAQRREEIMVTIGLLSIIVISYYLGGKYPYSMLWAKVKEKLPFGGTK